MCLCARPAHSSNSDVLGLVSVMGPVVVSGARRLANNSERRPRERPRRRGLGRVRGVAVVGSGDAASARVCLWDGGEWWWLKGAFEVCASDRDGERPGVLLRIYNPERPRL